MRIGILGAGQLGRMLALAGYPLGNEFVLLDTSGSPSAGLGDVIVDPDNLRLEDFLAQVDVVTYEFEHLPLTRVREIEAQVPVYPSSQALEVCQNRAHEKALFDHLEIPTPAYRVVDSLEALQAAVEALGCPVVAKSVTEGYDGKGQAVIRSVDEVAAAWHAIGHPQLMVETFVDFVREVSMIAVRGQDGDVRAYPMAENQHDEGILRYSVAPLPDLNADIKALADAYMQRLLEAMDYVGVLALELFQLADGRLLANEMAPRVHNSGHWTQDGAVTSQFENHLRAVQGLPLGDTQARQPTCMINVIGREPVSADVLALPDAHLHRYAKQERAGRKLGHINLVAPTHTALMARVDACARLLPEAPAPSLSFQADLADQ